MQSFLSKKGLISCIWLVMSEALVIWFFPALLLNIFKEYIPIKGRHSLTNALFVFTIVDILFCVTYIIYYVIKEQKQKKLNIEETSFNVTQKKGDFEWQQRNKQATGS